MCAHLLLSFGGDGDDVGVRCVIVAGEIIFNKF